MTNETMIAESTCRRVRLVNNNGWLGVHMNFIGARWSRILPTRDRAKAERTFVLSIGDRAAYDRILVEA